MLTLQKWDDARRLTGLKWVCAECMSVNPPAQVECLACGKQRWWHLGLSMADAAELADSINRVGQ